MRMLCKSPYMMGVLPAGCGQCMPCRINHRRVWCHRMVLESLVHGDSSFLTLTYSPENLPEGGNLVPKHAQDWLKRFRKAVAPRRVRFFLVGEYGDQTCRPHYHAAMFGVSRMDLETVRSTWGFGHVMLGDLTVQSAQYIAGYVTKKLTKEGDPRLCGRHPEFSRMSRNPGIGSLALNQIVEVLKSELFQRELEVVGDVPMSLNHGKRSMPLGRYLRRKLREHLGWNPEAPETSLQRYGAEMRKLFEDAFEVKENKEASLAQIFSRINVQKIRNCESRAKVYNAQRSL